MEEHLGEGKGRAEIDAVAVEPRRIGVEHAVAPRHEVEVVAEPAQERLEGVAVRVDGAGGEGLAGESHDARLALDRCGGSDPSVRDIEGKIRLEAAAGVDEIWKEMHRRGNSTPPA